jgi:transcriptional regulator with XRE-family HTH domain
MATGKQIRHYRDKLKWKLWQLAEASEVDIGTISALESRDSSKSQFFPQIAKAFGLTVEELADTSADHTPNPPGKSNPTLTVMEKEAHYKVVRGIDPWIAEATKTLEALSTEDRRAAVLNLRNFVQNLGPPRDGQALHVAG